MEASTRKGGRVTGPSDDDPGLIWFAEECKSNHVRVEALIRQAERARDPELAAFFRRARAVSERISATGDRSRPRRPA
jgi:hypothetical protein